MLFLVLPLPVFFFLRDGLDLSNRENRVLAPAPELSVQALPAFPSSFNAFFTDHLPYKNELAKLQGLLDYHFFKSSSSGSVLVGKEGWLFYKGSQLNGEDPLADYQGANLFSAKELEEIKVRFAEAKAYLESRGTKLYVMLPPNKERAYAENMPALYGPPSKACRLDQAARVFEELGIPVAKPLEALEDYKRDHPAPPLYFSYDTHWTRAGAYLSAKALSEQLGYSMPMLEEVPMAEGEPFAEDLAIQIGLYGILKDEPILNPYGYSPHQSEITVNEDLTEMDGYAQVGDNSSLLVIGDSFSTLMFPYLACHFDHAHMVIYYDYQESLLDEYEPDVVVLEVVERYLGNLPRFSIHDGVSRIF